jgi:hypothetical protein
VLVRTRGVPLSQQRLNPRAVGDASTAFAGRAAVMLGHWNQEVEMERWLKHSEAIVVGIAVVVILLAYAASRIL